MNGRDREEFHLVCYRCHCSIHIDCRARPECPKCLQRLEIRWRDPVESSPRASVADYPRGPKSLEACCR